MAEVDQELLRTLHRLHRQRTDLQSRIERGPRQLKSSQKKVAEVQAVLDDLKSRLQKAQLLANEKQLLLKQREDKIRNYEGKLNAASSNDEFQALKTQIAADQQANEVLSDEIYEQLEKIDVINADIKKVNEELAAAQAEVEKAQKKIDAELDQLKAELDRISQELHESEQKIPIDIKPNYQRVAASRGEESLAPLDGEVCGGCFQKITRMQHSDLTANKPVFCKSCGALIYLPENTRV